MITNNISHPRPDLQLLPYLAGCCSPISRPGRARPLLAPPQTDPGGGAEPADLALETDHQTDPVSDVSPDAPLPPRGLFALSNECCLCILLRLKHAGSSTTLPLVNRSLYIHPPHTSHRIPRIHHPSHRYPRNTAGLQRGSLESL